MLVSMGYTFLEVKTPRLSKFRPVPPAQVLGWTTDALAKERPRACHYLVRDYSTSPLTKGFSHSHILITAGGGGTVRAIIWKFTGSFGLVL